ncbi:MAG: hypothetical protein EBY45_01375 [Gammaproteobacteria bacterium]|nr:hypothetical protein [Gammaproteobacteria bacterium]
MAPRALRDSEEAYCRPSGWRGQIDFAILRPDFDAMAARTAHLRRLAAFEGRFGLATLSKALGFARK